MKKVSFEEALKQIMVADPRYDDNAYHFVRESLDFTVKMLSKPVEGPGRHVAGEELLEGIRQYALQEFGPIAKTVLNRWGVQSTQDFGEIVFSLVEHGILGKTDEDSKSDFLNGYDFADVFRRPFLPKAEPESARETSRKRLD